MISKQTIRGIEGHETGKSAVWRTHCPTTTLFHFGISLVLTSSIIPLLIDLTDMSARHQYQAMLKTAESILALCAPTSPPCKISLAAAPLLLSLPADHEILPATPFLISNPDVRKRLLRLARDLIEISQCRARSTYEEMCAGMISLRHYGLNDAELTRHCAQAVEEWFRRHIKAVHRTLIVACDRFMAAQDEGGHRKTSGFNAVGGTGTADVKLTPDVDSNIRSGVFALAIAYSTGVYSGRRSSRDLASTGKSFNPAHPVRSTDSQVRTWVRSAPPIIPSPSRPIKSNPHQNLGHIHFHTLFVHCALCSAITANTPLVPALCLDDLHQQLIRFDPRFIIILPKR